MDLIYLRHGRTDWNDLHRLQGRSDVPLNESGIEGAKKAAKVLKNYRFDGVYCSPLLRTRQTLEYAYPGAEPIYDDRLMEWCFGVHEGKRMPGDFFEKYWRFGQERVEGGELIEDVVARVSEFYRDIKKRHPDGLVLVVSHGGVSGAMHGAVYGVSAGENLSEYCLPNTTPVLFREGQAPIYLEEEK